MSVTSPMNLNVSTETIIARINCLQSVQENACGLHAQLMAPAHYIHLIAARIYVWWPIRCTELGMNAFKWKSEQTESSFQYIAILEKHC